MIKHRNLIVTCIGVILLFLLYIILMEEIIHADFVYVVPAIFRLSVLETKYLYFLHHAISFIPVFFLSISTYFLPSRWQLYKDWLLAIFLGSIIFIIWDYSFCKLGIWSYNARYIMGVQILGLPIEELLWFPCIGVCSIFIHALCIKIPLKGDAIWKILFILIGLATFGFQVVHMDRLYTAFSIWSIWLCLLLFYSLKLGSELIQFLRSFCIILGPMFLMDGLLTGMWTNEAVVIYNPQEFSGIRIISIPIEDFFFGFSFLAIIVIIKSVINGRLSEEYTLRK